MSLEQVNPFSTKALRALADALDSVEKARAATTQSVADDYCINALDELKKAFQEEATSLINNTKECGT